MTGTTTATDPVYRERTQLIALLAALYPSHIGYTDPSEPDWAVITIQTPTGQLSWHISRADMDLLRHVEPTTSDHPAWDGHTTEQKYRRIRDLIDAIDAGEQPRAAYAPTAPDAETFEVGKYYIAENEASVFQCNQVTADGKALGPELQIDGHPAADRRYTYLAPGVRGLYREIDEADVHAKHGEHGWVHRPKARTTAGN